jgi:hypothetical protein
MDEQLRKLQLIELETLKSMIGICDHRGLFLSLAGNQ